MFADRKDAGQKLAARLAAAGLEAPVILALPRGGVPVAAEIARALGAPLDLVMVRKLGVPGHPELAAGAVTDGETPQILVNEEITAHAGLDAAAIGRLAERERAEIERRRALWLPGRAAVPLSGRTAVVVDDGAATGATLRVALRALAARGPARVVVALPVAPPEVCERLRGEADEVICLETPRRFSAVGQYYRDFAQVPDAEVTRLMQAAATP